MFDISEIRTFTHDVPIIVPVDGGFEDRNLKTTFNYIDVEETQKFDLRTPEGTTAFLVRIVSMFHDLMDGEKNPVPYTEAVRDALLRKQYVRQGLANYYFDALGKAKEGN